MRRMIAGRFTSLFLTGLVLSVLPAVARAENKPEEITFDTFDGVKLQGDWYPSDKTTKAPTALLIHKIGGDHKQMAPVAEALQAAGFAVLSFDLRGHGGKPDHHADRLLEEPAKRRRHQGLQADPEHHRRQELQSELLLVSGQRHRRGEVFPGKEEQRP